MLLSSKDDASQMNNLITLPVALVAREGRVTGLTLGVPSVFHPSTHPKPD